MSLTVRLAIALAVPFMLALFLAQGSVRGIANETLDSDRAPLFPNLQEAAEALGSAQRHRWQR